MAGALVAHWAMMLQASTVATPPQPINLQEVFDAATQAWAARDCAKALPLFAQLATQPSLKPGSLPAAAVAARQGDCILRQPADPQAEADAEARVVAALPVLRAAGSDFEEEVASSEYQLGLQAMKRWDHDTALEHLRAALKLTKGSARLPMLSKLVQLTAFDGNREALDAAEEGLALATAEGGPDLKNAQAQWHSLHARVLLNQGQFKAARQELMTAFELTGRDKMRLSLVETLMRADLGMAAMLDNDRKAAQEYTAMSGAGLLGASTFKRALAIGSPDCGAETGIDPQDVAVVEFSLGANGQVTSARTIYAPGSYAKAAAFAKAVAQWAWSADDAGKIPDFFRAAARVELRCSAAQSPGLSLKLSAQEALLKSQPSLQPTDGVPWRWTALDAAAKAAQAKGDARSELVARSLLAMYDLGPRTRALESVMRGLGLAKVEPDAALGALAQVVLVGARQDLEEAGKPGKRNALRADADRQELLQLAQAPNIAQNPVAKMLALLFAADIDYRLTKASTNRAILQTAVDETRLGERHPLRQYALLRLANIAASDKDLAKAQSLFAATGLDVEQCAVLAPKMAIAKNEGASYFFPEDALQLGFEGWAQTEFDVTTKGATARQRVTAAYPPFIFGPAAQKILSAVRFEPSYRPGNGADASTACSARTESVVFANLMGAGVKVIQQKAK